MIRDVNPRGWRGLLHRLAHLFRLNYGTVETWWHGEHLMVGFKCRTCGRLTGVHESFFTR